MVDRAKEPGIRFTGVAVDRIRFDDVAVGETPSKELVFQFAIRRKLWSTPPAADVTVSVRAVPSGDTASRFALEISMTGRFETSEEPPNMSLEQFAKLNGPTHVMPFLRELIANITARSRRGIVLLPPINVLALVEREEQQAQSSGTT